MLVNNLDISGGYQKLVLRLSEQLLKDKHDISIYTFSVNREKCYPDILKNIEIISLPKKNKKDTFFKKIIYIVFENVILIRKNKKLAKLIPENLDALIIHDEQCLHILNYKNIKNTQIIWMLNNQLSNDFNPIIETIKNNFKKIKKLKNLIISIIRFPQLIIGIFSLKSSILKINEFAVYDSFNKELVGSKIKREAKIVFAGADLEKFKKIFHKREYAKEKEYKIISVGVFFPHRRYEDIIEAVNILRKDGIKIQAEIIGRQDQHVSYSNKVINMIKEIGLENHIICKKEIDDIEMANLYKNADIFCFVNDGFTWGISVFEAVAAGIPIVITNNIGAADIIKNEIDGFVINPCKPQEIAASIKNIISDDKKTNIIINNAYNTVENIVSWKSFSDRIIKLIQI